MNRQIAFVVGTAMCVGAASGQVVNPNLGAAGSIVPTMKANEAGGQSGLRGPTVASLTYDGTSSWGFAGQDFENMYNAYDIFVCERFGTIVDANLTDFYSNGYGTSNPFGATDMIVEIYRADCESRICDDETLPVPLMTSVAGAGYWDGAHGATDMGGQCLPAGDYILRWGIELNFVTFGQVFFFAQAGPHDNGLGDPDDGFQSNPGGAFGMGFCFPTVDNGTGLPTGVNFILVGDLGDCDSCPDPTDCGDWDGDCDSDGDDFFAYLGSFNNGDPCADLTSDGLFNIFDFFAFLDAFLQPC